MNFDGLSLKGAGALLKAGDPSVRGPVDVRDALADPDKNVVYVVWTSGKREAAYDDAASSDGLDAAEEVYKDEVRTNASAVFVNDGEDGRPSAAAHRLDAKELRRLESEYAVRRVKRKAPDLVLVVR